MYNDIRKYSLKLWKPSPPTIMFSDATNYKSNILKSYGHPVRSQKRAFPSHNTR
jgi:hypothetical protein